jgi:transposase
VGYAPTHGRHANLLFGLGLRGIVAPLVYLGTTTEPYFTAYAQQYLAPSLHAGEIVLVDRHTVHRASAIRPALRARGDHLWFLPPYSPDLSPIELCGSKVKDAVRRLEPRTYDTLVEATGKALATITPHDIVGWFQHCGYHIRSL